MSVTHSATTFQGIGKLCPLHSFYEKCLPPALKIPDGCPNPLLTNKRRDRSLYWTYPFLNEVLDPLAVKFSRHSFIHPKRKFLALVWLEAKIFPSLFPPLFKWLAWSKVHSCPLPDTWEPHGFLMLRTRWHGSQAFFGLDRQQLPTQRKNPVVTIIRSSLSTSQENVTMTTIKVGSARKAHSHLTPGYLLTHLYKQLHLFQYSNGKNLSRNEKREGTG